MACVVTRKRRVTKSAVFGEDLRAHGRVLHLRSALLRAQPSALDQLLRAQPRQLRDVCRVTDERVELRCEVLFLL